jgi:hypothetical protein
MKWIVWGLLCGTFASVQAQTAELVLKKVMELQMPDAVTDDMPGTRGACVAWHPGFRQYYAAFAGNGAFPFAVFDEKGLRKPNNTLTCELDTRGIWYHAPSKTLMMNGYDDIGWAKYTLDAKGIPTGLDVKFEGYEHQPTEQSVGVYKASDNQVLFLDNAVIWYYDAETGEEVDKTKDLFLGITPEMAKEDPSLLKPSEPDIWQESYNTTSMAYTGKKGAEIGLLNLERQQIEIYNEAIGLLVQVLTLPMDAVELSDKFNFAYANGIFWLFDMEARKWLGFK